MGKNRGKKNISRYFPSVSVWASLLVISARFARSTVSIREKVNALNVREWKIARESPLRAVCRESLVLCKQTPATKWKPCFTVHYLFSHGSRPRQVELPFLSHREMRNFDRRLLISALPSLVRLRRNWTNQRLQKLINPIHFEMNVLPEAPLVPFKV